MPSKVKSTSSWWKLISLNIACHFNAVSIRKCTCQKPLNAIFSICLYVCNLLAIDHCTFSVAIVDVEVVAAKISANV